jgi:hypothetical protein
MSSYTGVQTDDAANGSQLPIASVTVGASPFTYHAAQKCHVNLSGGTVTGLSHLRGSQNVALGGSNGSFSLSAGDALKITYSVAPTVVVVPA